MALAHRTGNQRICGHLVPGCRAGQPNCDLTGPTRAGHSSLPSGQPGGHWMQAFFQSEPVGHLSGSQGALGPAEAALCWDLEGAWGKAARSAWVPWTKPLSLDLPEHSGRAWAASAASLPSAELNQKLPRKQLTTRAHALGRRCSGAR